MSFDGTRDVYHTTLPSLLAPSYSTRSRSAPLYLTKSARVDGLDVCADAAPERLAKRIMKLTNNFTYRSLADHDRSNLPLIVARFGLETMVTICEKLYFYAALLFALRG